MMEDIDSVDNIQKKVDCCRAVLKAYNEAKGVYNDDADSYDVSFLIQDFHSMTTYLDVLSIYYQLVQETIKQKSKLQNPSIIQMIYFNTLQSILSNSVLIRLKALNLLQLMLQYEKSFDCLDRKILYSIQCIGMKLLKDYDVRIRRASLELLLVMIEFSQLKYDFSNYESICEMIKDSDMEVRYLCLRTLSLYTLLFNNKRVLSQYTSSHMKSKGKKIAIMDQSFIYLCEFMNDIEVKIRIESCKLASQFIGVTGHLLLQGFNKQKIPVEATLLSSTKTQIKDYVLNQALEDVINEFGIEKSKECDIYSLHDSICGIFVILLEDEYAQVRLEALNCIYSFCIQNPYNEAFIIESFESYLDCFNDEDEEIRAHAIQLLYQLCKKLEGSNSNVKLKLNKDNIEALAGCLDDANSNIRHGIQLLLTTFLIQYQDFPTLIKLILEALAYNIMRYPQDTASILSVCKFIGQFYYFEITLELMNELLDMDIRFLKVEPSFLDLNYTLKALVILQASSKNEILLDHLPEFLKKHYIYYSCKYPEPFQFEKSNTRPIQVFDSFMKATWSCSKHKV